MAVQIVEATRFFAEATMGMDIMEACHVTIKEEIWCHDTQDGDLEGLFFEDPMGDYEHDDIYPYRS